MKIAILGDCHIGMRTDSVVFHELYREFYTNTFLSYLEKYNIKDVVQLGDLFDRRKYINFLSLKLAKEYLFNPLSDNGINFHTLIGNHDSFYKNTIDVNSTSLTLGEYSNIKIYASPDTVQFDGTDFDIIPWICDDNQEQVMNFINASRSDYCFGHFELAGFEMDRGNVCNEGSDRKMLSRYEMVFSGHFHHRSTQGNVMYVGSPGEMIWSDCDDPRGFHIFDTETRSVEFIQNPYTIFRKLNYNDDDMYLDDVQNKDFSEYKNKYVKVIVSKKTNAFLFESFIDGLMKAGPVDVSIVEDFTEVTDPNDLHEVDQADDTTTILDKYIDTIEIDLNKSKLKSIIKEVYTEALTIDS